MSAKLVYVTVPTEPAAAAIAETVVHERLAACANFFSGATSVFEWNGTLCREQETILILKTSAQKAKALTGRIQALHPFECPCVAVLPIEGGNPDFLSWIEKSTAC